MPFVSFLERSFAYCARLSIAIRNLGFRNALTTFLSIRRGSELRSIHLPRLGRSVYFRSAADKGAISHLFYPGTRILDTSACRARVIVDAGANIGMETIRMRHFHPDARVLAVEADAGNYSVLQRNAEQDKGYVQTLHKGVWSSDTSLRILAGPTNEGFKVRAAGPDEPGDLEAVTMNTILTQVGGEIDILKMDIEGAEYEVFSRNMAWIEHVKAFIFECPDHDHPGAAFQIFRALAHLPFDTFVSGENVVLIRRDTGWKVETTPYL